MAVGDTDVTICNKALLLLGAEAITSFSDGTPAAQACNISTKRLKATLGMYKWSFIIVKTQLSEIAIHHRMNGRINIYFLTICLLVYLKL